MNYIKTLLMSVVMAFSMSSFAKEAPAHVLERCGHDIMKLVKNKQLPEEVMTKLHMVQIAEDTVNNVYKVVAVLDHNQDHSKPVAHVKFNYGIDDGKMIDFTYVEGYVNPAATPFTGASTAKLLDLAAEVLMDSTEASLQAYAQTVRLMHIDFDAATNEVLFEMLNTANEQLNVRLTLAGDLVSYEFITAGQGEEEHP